MNLSSDSEFTSSSEFDSSTDPSEEDLSEHTICIHTNPELMVPIPGPEFQLQEVNDLWECL